MSRSKGKLKHDKLTRIDPEKMLSEKVAEGLTLGPEAEEEAKEKFPNLPGALDLSYLTDKGGAEIKFRCFDTHDPNVLIRFPDGRLFSEPAIAFTAEDKKRIELGYVCLRCLEPQSGANADDHLPGCIGVGMHGPRYMRSGQHLIDVAAEFDDSNIHVGPSRPLSAYADELEDRKLKRVFEEKVKS